MSDQMTRPAATMDSSATPKAIVRRTLHDELLERLRDLIIDGDLAPGVKIPERELCERFGVSRTPLREALKVLARENLVILNPNRGAQVSELTVMDLEEVFPVMGALEALAGEMACGAITDEEITAIEATHAEMLRQYEARSLDAYFRLNQQIHERILQASRNPTLVTIYRGLAGRIRRARYLANMSAPRWAQAVAEHEEMLAALKARDGARLGNILRRHLANKFATVKESLAMGQ